MNDNKIKIPRKGKARIIIGCILMFFQLISVLGDTSVFDIPAPQSFYQLLYDIIFFTSYFLISIVGLILLISGIVAYNKSGMTEENNKEQPVRKKKAVTKRFNVHPTLKIVLFSMLILLCCFLCIIGITSINEFHHYYDEIFYLILGIILTFSSAFLLVVCFCAFYKACLQQRSLNRRSIRYKEKCYKKVDKIHVYCERGSITQEEFETLKEEILSKIERGATYVRVSDERKDEHSLDSQLNEIREHAEKEGYIILDENVSTKE